jgi:hypothetical protein
MSDTSKAAEKCLDEEMAMENQNLTILDYSTYLHQSPTTAPLDVFLSRGEEK